MTPRQARVALGAFVLLAAGVTGNALYLQGDVDRTAAKTAASPPPRAEPRRQPVPPVEPKEPKAKAGKPPDRSAAVAPPPDQPKTGQPKTDQAKGDQAKGAQAVKVRVVRVATIEEGQPEDTDPDTVRAVQTELSRLGYGPVATDGVINPATSAAIMAFEHEQRLALTGEATQELLKQLLFGAPVATGAASPPEARSPRAQAMIRQVQQMLAERGYRPGAADGRLSAETVSAIRTFEADQGLIPKGRISVALLERLESGMAGGGRHKDP
jgi:peptidoglycan hydrolase-like protein with peptidoglycan-binding domain